LFYLKATEYEIAVLPV